MKNGRRWYQSIWRTWIKAELKGENISLPPVSPVGGSTWEPDCEQETSFGGETHRAELMKDYIKDLYKKLSGNIGKTAEAFHFDYFKVEGGNYTEDALNNWRGAKIG